MKKRNFVIGVTKLMAGVLVAGAVVSAPVTNVYAYTPSSSTTNQLGVKCDTIDVKTLCEAKALVEELKKDGVKANLTLNCYDADIENYLKTNLTNVPIATLYECIKFVQKGGNSTTNQNNTNNQNGNNTTNQNNTNNQNGNNTTNQNNANNQNGNNTTTSPNNKEDEKENTVATVDPEDKANSATTTTVATDKSPKTGDSTSILIMGGVMMLSMFGMMAVYFRKRRHV